MKIAFVVQQDWLNVHFGVRNLFVACCKILMQQGHDVDFITFEKFYNKTLWYRIFVRDDDLKSSIKKTTIDTRKKYSKLVFHSQNFVEFEKQFIGEEADKNYTTLIFTNPWLLCTLDALKSNAKKILICHDCGANILTLLENIEIKYWGYEHNEGYRFALKQNMHFLSNSKKTDDEIVKFYNPEKHSYLPPVPTYGFFDANFTKECKKEKAVVLAAPFDTRKGLEIMPQYLNSLANDMQTLYIYGTPRCEKTKYKEFYKKLKFKNVVHYNKITTTDLISLYKKCKFLFFPSIDEGLGIPIIEAQLCGCRVVTTNKSPMNELLCDGNYLLCEDIKEDIKHMRAMLQEENFDYGRLSSEAKEKFSIAKIYNEFRNIGCL